MSVQAQYPSNLLFSEFRKRARPEACDYGIGDLLIQEGHLHLCSAGVNLSSQPTMNTGILAEDGVPRHPVCVRKKPREETLMSKQQLSTAPLNNLDAERCAFMIPICGERSFPSAQMNVLPQQTAWACSSGIPSVVDNTRLAPTATTTSGLGANANAACCSLLDDATLHLHFCQQQAEIDQIITSHGEQLKQALEEKRQQHTRSLLNLIDYSMLFRVKDRLVEIERIRRHNVELEDYVKKLSLESQMWMDIAQSQEALVTSLRSNLEQVVAQSNEKSKARFGESEAEDAESCVYGASPASGEVNVQAQEIRELKEQRNCRFCRKRSISVLLLPCRHLCLCTDCDSTLGKCPICGASKDASLLVYMD